MMQIDDAYPLVSHDVEVDVVQSDWPCLLEDSPHDLRAKSKDVSLIVLIDRKIRYMVGFRAVTEKLRHLQPCLTQLG